MSIRDELCEVLGLDPEREDDEYIMAKAVARVHAGGQAEEVLRKIEAECAVAHEQLKIAYMMVGKVICRDRGEL